MPPHRTKLRPSSGQVGPKLKPTGRKLRPLLLRSTKGQGRPSLTPVGFWLGQVGPLLSSLFYSLGAGGSRREATRRTSSAERLANIIKYPHLYPLMYTHFQVLNIYSECTKVAPVLETRLGFPRPARRWWDPRGCCAEESFPGGSKSLGKMGMPSKTLSKNELNTKELLSPKIGNKNEIWDYPQIIKHTKKNQPISR